MSSSFFPNTLAGWTVIAAIFLLLTAMLLPIFSVVRGSRAYPYGPYIEKATELILREYPNAIDERTRVRPRAWKNGSNIIVYWGANSELQNPGDMRVEFEENDLNSGKVIRRN
jgi:hypothetical protein